jgi:topoisomerase-4 subunit A
VLQALTQQLREQLKAELEFERARLLDRQHWLTLEQIFVEKRVYKKIERAGTEAAVRSGVWDGMHEHEALFVRAMVDDDIKRLLEIRIRRISLFDIEKNKKDLKGISRGIKDCDRKLGKMKKTTVDYLKGLLAKYGEQFPRRTEIALIMAVDKKAVARQNIKLAYDSDTGYFGSNVRGERFKLSVSEFDLILAIAKDGSYRIMPPPDRMLFDAKLLYCAVFDPEQPEEFVVVYRDAKRICFGKRIAIEKFVRNREYKLIRDKAGRIDLLLRPEEAGVLSLAYTPATRQRIKGSKFDLGDLIPTAASARGTRLGAKPVSRLQHLGRKRPRKRTTQTGARPRRKPATSSPTPRRKGPKGGGQGELF